MFYVRVGLVGQNLEQSVIFSSPWMTLDRPAASNHAGFNNYTPAEATLLHFPRAEQIKTNVGKHPLQGKTSITTSTQVLIQGVPHEGQSKFEQEGAQGEGTALAVPAS
jgi:hypothetical protein